MRHDGDIGRIPRAAMPQISTAKQGAFLDWLRGAGVAVASADVAASALAKTQAEIFADKVTSLADAPAAVRAKRVIVSVDGFVLDGHHHWALAALTGHDVPVWVVGLEMAELLAVAGAWVEAA